MRSKIIIRPKISEQISGHLKNLGNKFAIITDSKVEKLYAGRLQRILQREKISAEIFSFPEGEKQKNLQTIEALAAQMLKKGFDRKDALITLGGGVVGDLGGFLASIYMRGIPYVHIPTTLLAMVDSAIGGKTGVDLIEGKNLLGVFYQPQAVFIDPDFLKTLPLKQIRNGLAEVIKYGVIKDAKLFQFIEKNLEKILHLDKTVMNKIIIQSAQIKEEIVKKDEKEQKERMLLNYGHSFGHVLEKLSNYTLLHGHAISIGMVLANKFAVEKKILDRPTAERIKKLLIKAGLPVATMKNLTLKDLSTDKKKAGTFINLILPSKIGKAIIYKAKIS